MQLDCHPIPINLMHNQVKHRDRFKLKDNEHWLDTPGFALIQNKVSEVFGLNSLHRHLDFRLHVHVTYRGNEPYMREGHYAVRHGGAKSNMMHEQEQPTQFNL
jgi:hypothetical protein